MKTTTQAASGTARMGWTRAPTEQQAAGDRGRHDERHAGPAGTPEDQRSEQRGRQRPDDYDAAEDVRGGDERLLGDALLGELRVLALQLFEDEGGVRRQDRDARRHHQHRRVPWTPT